MQITYAESGQIIRGPLPSEDFSVSLDQTPTIVAGSSTPATVKDINWSAVTTGAYSDNNFRINTASGATFENQTPEIIDVDASGNVALKAGQSGLAIVDVAVAGKGKRRVTQQMVRTYSTATIYGGGVSYVAGSLRKYLYDQTEAICAHVASLLGASPDPTAYSPYQKYFIDDIADGSLDTSSLNTGMMLNLTGVAGFTPFDTTYVASDEVWISAHHKLRGIGFVHGQVPAVNQRAVGTDALVTYSVSAVPNANMIVKFLPANWQSYLPEHFENTDLGFRVPVWARLYHTGIETPQPRRYWVMPVMETFGRLKFPMSGNAVHFCRSRDGTLGDAGDSGSPVFCGINGTPVMLGRVWGGGALTDWYAGIAPAIEAAMNDLATQYADPAAGTYALQTVDLSGFNTY